MEGFCRGCLLQSNEPIDFVQYTEKNRRLFVYSTGIQVKRNDSFTFQLCKECYFNMRQSCKFKKQCRTSEKKFKSYLMLKEDGVDLESFIKNIDGNVSFRLSFTSGHSTPAQPTNKDDDNESTCTSIRNFMTDILEGEEMPLTEARIIREVIEEEADVLDDSLDSHWLQDDLSIGSDFNGVFGSSPFGTPRSAQNKEFYTPRSIDEAKQRELNYITSKEIINKIDKSRITQKFDMPLLENIDLKDEECTPKPDIDDFQENTDVKSNTTDLHEFDNSIPSEVEDMVTENSISSTLQFFKHELLKDANKNIENDNASFVTYDKTLALSKAPERTVSNTDDMFIILSHGKTRNQDDTPLTNELEFYVNKVEFKKQISLSNDKKEYHCTIDRNLDIALKNAESKEFLLDQLIVTPAVSVRSGVSTPTINNILFGGKDTKTQLSTSTPIHSTLFEGKHDTQSVPKYFPQVGQNIEDCDDDKSDVNLEDYFYDEFEKTDKCTDEVKIEETVLNSNVLKKRMTDKNSECDHIEVLEEFLRDADNDTLEIKDKIIDPVVLLDEDLFKRPVTPPYDKYDLENCLCKVCDKTFTSCRSLKIHVARKHKYQFPSTDRNISRKSKVIVCEVCGSDVKGGKSNYQRHLLRHQDTEEQFYQCDVCTIIFKSRKSLQLHMRLHNNMTPVRKKKNFLCNICGKISGTSSHHRKHLIRHRKEPTVMCKICNQGYYTNYDLEQHVKTRHNGELPYVCQYCDKKYKRLESLRHHLLRHLGKYDYKCDVCKVEFTSKAGLTYHFGTLKCTANRQKLILNNSNEDVTVRYGKGCIEKIKRKMLCTDAEDTIESIEDPDYSINSTDTENDAEMSVVENV